MLSRDKIQQVVSEITNRFIVFLFEVLNPRAILRELYFKWNIDYIAFKTGSERLMGLEKLCRMLYFIAKLNGL